jgi:hypothetical protein
MSVRLPKAVILLTRSETATRCTDVRMALESRDGLGVSQEVAKLTRRYVELAFPSIVSFDGLQ